MSHMSLAGTVVTSSSVADLRGGEGRPPVQILLNSCSFWEILAKMLTPPPGEFAPLLGEILDPPLLIFNTSGYQIPEFAEFNEFNESSAPLRKNSSVFTNYLSFETGRQLSPEEYNELGSARESWCAVERKKEQDWCRATRKHYPTEHLKSEVLTGSAPGEEPRCTWNVDKPTHKEKRHYTSWSK